MVGNQKLEATKAAAMAAYEMYKQKIYDEIISLKKQK